MHLHATFRLWVFCKNFLQNLSAILLNLTGQDLSFRGAIYMTFLIRYESNSRGEHFPKRNCLILTNLRRYHLHPIQPETIFSVTWVSSTGTGLTLLSVASRMCFDLLMKSHHNGYSVMWKSKHFRPNHITVTANSIKSEIIMAKWNLSMCKPNPKMATVTI